MKYITLSLIVLAPSTALAAPPAIPAAPAAVAPSEPLQEVEVTGERPGPGMWRITKGGHVLWLFGTFDPLPKHMTWRSRDVESVVAQSQEVLASYPSPGNIGPITWIRLYLQWRRTEKIPEKSHLKDWLTPADYARFAALKARYAPHDGSIEELRPLVAANRLYEKAIDASGLTSRTSGLNARNPIEDAVLKLARKHGVSVRQTRLRIDNPRGALAEVGGEIPRQAEIGCLDATMARLETDLDAMKARARDWALGDVEALRRLPFPKQREACVAALFTSARFKALFDQATADWNAELEASLARNQTTLALKPIYDLISADGTLALLRAKGYTVEGP